MILTQIDRQGLPDLLDGFAQAVAGHRLAGAVFRRITAILPEAEALALSTDAGHHAQALALCRSFGFAIAEVDPHSYFTWDGRAVASGMEPSVIIHEIGHYQWAAAPRRTVLDFGLGAGPETGRKAEANAVQTVFGVEGDIEEGLASLQGILWEAELGQPALAAFIEQNWLENGVSLHNIGHFLKMVELLARHRLIDDRGHPTRALRQQEDAAFFAAWHTL